MRTNAHLHPHTQPRTSSALIGGWLVGLLFAADGGGGAVDGASMAGVGGGDVITRPALDPTGEAVRTLMDLGRGFTGAIGKGAGY